MHPINCPRENSVHKWYRWMSFVNIWKGRWYMPILHMGGARNSVQCDRSTHSKRIAQFEPALLVISGKILWAHKTFTTIEVSRNRVHMIMWQYGRVLVHPIDMYSFRGFACVDWICLCVNFSRSTFLHIFLTSRFAFVAACTCVGKQTCCLNDTESFDFSRILPIFACVPMSVALCAHTRLRQLGDLKLYNCGMSWRPIDQASFIRLYI